MRAVSVLSQEAVSTTLFVPEGSVIRLTCTANHSGPTLFWELQSTDIPTAERYISENEQRFQSFGYYQIRENNEILLYINSTDLNLTNVTCLGRMFGSESPTLLRRTFLTYGRCHKTSMSSLPAIVYITDANQETFVLVPNIVNETGRILISWSPLTSLGARQVYNVTVVSENTQPRSFQQSEPKFNFSAPDDAPPCEIYTFSVTATPDGANYTGDGCSVSSGVLTMMLPSLPDITPLESSLNYTLASVIGNRFQLKAFFMVRGLLMYTIIIWHCDDLYQKLNTLAC